MNEIIDKNKPLFILIIISILSIVAIVVFLIKDAVREVVIKPVLYIIWLLSLLIRAVPQQLLWSLIILLGAYIFLSKVLDIRLKEDISQNEIVVYQSRLDKWKDWIELAIQGDYFKKKLFNEIGDVIVDSVAFKEQLDKREVLIKIRSGEIILPFKFEKNERYSKSLSKFQMLLYRFYAPEKNISITQEVEEIINYLEREMEI